MIIKRDNYLEQLISGEKNGLIKIVTGIRRCGKSYLLFTLFHDYLIAKGIDRNHIIEIALDDRKNVKLRDPDDILKYIKGQIKDKKLYYIILDEVQLIKEFEDVLNSLLHIKNVDVYVTGSNSKFLSSDIVTEFRGRGDQIHMYPLSFSEFKSAFFGSIEEAWKQYYTFGGLPQILSLGMDRKKMDYLRDIFESVYIADIIERNSIRNDEELKELVQILASGIGGLTNPAKLVNTFKSIKKSSISRNTVVNYMDYMRDSFLIEKAMRFDIKGKKYIDTPVKYYFSDLGLRNAILSFRQQEENNIMENIVYNELRIRGYSVDIGVIDTYGKDDNRKTVRKQLEVDFIANKGNKKYYIQSVFRLSTEEKREQEERSLLKIDDSFQKVIIIGDDIYPKRNEKGILTIGIKQFLLDENSLEL